MKNLNEELRKLDEYNVRVSSDFSKKVMKKIRKGSFTNQLRYVVSFASVAAVACFAVVLYSNSDLKDKFFATKNHDSEFQVSESNNMNGNMSYQDTNHFLEGKDNYIFDSMESVKENLPLSDASEDFEAEDNKMFSDSESRVDGTNIDSVHIQSENDSMKPASNGAVANSTVKVEENNDKLKKILQILQKAEFQVEEIENGLKVKATKKEVTDTLEEVEDLEFEEEEGYVILKLK